MRADVELPQSLAAQNPASEAFSSGAAHMVVACPDDGDRSRRTSYFCSARATVLGVM